MTSMGRSLKTVGWHVTSCFNAHTLRSHAPRLILNRPLFRMDRSPIPIEAPSEDAYTPNTNYNILSSRKDF
eukprot:3918985-Amphidinium_carterae.1